MRPLVAEIDIAALRGNWGVLSRQADADHMFAVVKDNAYGHGLLIVADALRGTADGFALLEVNDAVLLRESGIRKPILLLSGVYERQDMDAVAEHDLWIVLHENWQLDLIQKSGVPNLRVFLKIDTGMNRLGFPLSEVDNLLEKLSKLDHVAEVTLMTHFAHADEVKGVAEQMKLVKSSLMGRDHQLSLSNSGAVLLHPPGVRQAWARPGIALYGVSPNMGIASAEQLDLKPVMTLMSQIIAVKDVSAGDQIGYGGKFTAPTDMRVGVVAGGYGDGFLRSVPEGATVLVDEALVPVVGTISMDLFAVDLRNAPGSDIGSSVVLWGKGSPVEKLAVNTIANEFLVSTDISLQRRIVGY